MKNIICKIKGHKLSISNKRSKLIEEYTCTHCNQKFTTDGYGDVVKLNSFWRENNMLFEKILHNKQAS